MDQETRWLKRYDEVKGFIGENHRNPSKHRIEEHDMLNWVKQQRIDGNQPCGWFSALMGEEERSLHVGRDDSLLSFRAESSARLSCVSAVASDQRSSGRLASPRNLMRSLHALRLVEMTRGDGRDDR